MSYKALKIGELELSPYNVRKDKRALTPTSIGVMAGSILKHGQIMPIGVHPMRGRKGVFGVFAGQRRFLAIKSLIEAGTLPIDTIVDAIVREAKSEADLIDMSTAENLVRVDLYDYETYGALARSFRRGHTYEQIAEGLGQPDVNWVKRGVRLGMLAEPIFKAYADGLLGLECAKAFAATDDNKLQLQAYAEFQRLPAASRTPTSARQLLKVGDRELTRLFLFVGEKAYIAEGGRFELDLFASDGEFRGLVTDEALLRGMADARLETMRKQIRARAGRQLRFEPSPPMNDFNQVDISLRIQPPESPLDPADEARLVELALEQADLVSRATEFVDEGGQPKPGTEAAIAELDARLDANEAETAAIEARRPILLPDGDIFGTITIDDTGEAEERYWWPSRAAQAAASRPEPRREALPVRKQPSNAHSTPAPAAKTADMRPVGEGDAIRTHGGNHSVTDWSAGERADRFIKRDAGVTQEGIQAMRSLRREILRGQLIEDSDRGGTVALDYLVFAQLRMLLTKDDPAAVGLRCFNRPDRQDSIGAELIAETTAGRFGDAFDEMRGWPCFTIPDLEKAFLAYRSLEAMEKRHAATMLACLGLERSLEAEGYRIPLHNCVAAATGVAGGLQLRELDAFTPSPAFFNLFSKEHRLALIEPLVDRGALVVAAKARTADQNAIASRLFCGDSADFVSDEAREVAVAWVHPLLAFSPAELGDASADRELEEAAE